MPLGQYPIRGTIAALALRVDIAPLCDKRQWSQYETNIFKVTFGIVFAQMETCLYAALCHTPTTKTHHATICHTIYYESQYGTNKDVVTIGMILAHGLPASLCRLPKVPNRENVYCE